MRYANGKATAHDYNKNIRMCEAIDLFKMNETFAQQTGYRFVENYWFGICKCRPRCNRMEYDTKVRVDRLP